jgi:hypothetical protein
MEDSIGVNTQNDIISRHATAKTAEIDDSSKQKLKENLEQYEQLFGADEDAFDQPTTSRKELWSYYLYYNVRSPLGPNILTQITNNAG